MLQSKAFTTGLFVGRVSCVFEWVHWTHTYITFMHIFGSAIIVQVTESDLIDYVGHPVFSKQRLYSETPVGVVMGLAWNTMGGSTLYIEVCLCLQQSKRSRYLWPDLSTARNQIPILFHRRIGTLWVQKHERTQSQTSKFRASHAM